jgi:DNA-binding MarR family transcriptional regulator
MSDPQTLYSLINEIYLILDDGDRRLLNGFNLTSTRFYALVHISERPGISFSELSQLLLCDKSNASRIIRGLESEGLVVRRPHETDGRTSRLFLSSDGEELRRKASSAHQQYTIKRFIQLAPNDQEQLNQGLINLKRSLFKHLDSNHEVESTA